MKKKLLCTVLSATMVAAMLAGCGSSDNANTQTPSSDTQAEAQQPAADAQQPAADTQTPASGEGKVYYLNFKPEQGAAWEAACCKIYGGNRRSRFCTDGGIRNI